MRLIDADELKEEAIKAQNREDTNSYINMGLARAVELIANAPTVDTTFREVVAYECGQKSVEERPKGEWVPVSERLPEEEGDYLLWGKIDENEEDEYSFIGSYDEGFEQFGIWHEQFDSRTLGSLGSEFYEYSKVVAWMPLPEPYKRGGDTI